MKKEEVLKVISLSADEIEELAHKYFGQRQLVRQNPEEWGRHVRSFTAGYKAGAKAMQELYQKTITKPSI